MEQFYNRTVLITGASSGIGKTCALHLAKRGFNVVAGVRNDRDAQALHNEKLNNLKTITLDITKKEDIASAVRFFSNDNLYAIVNNAGTAVLGPIEFVPVDSVRKQFEVNLFGHIALTQALLPKLRASGGSRIVNMSSISGMMAFPFYGPYALSKFALEAFNDALRRELKPWRIKVISIQPGNVATPIWHKSFLTASSILTGFPPEAMSLYEGNLLTSEKPTDDMTKPSAVAHAVFQALSSSHPRTRYRVGKDAKKYAVMLRLLPTRLLDKLLCKLQG